MGLFQRIEDIIDNRTPKLEVSGITKEKFDTKSFNALILKLVSEPTFKLRSRKNNEIVLNVAGRKIMNIAHTMGLYSKKPTAKIYKNLKSRFKVTLQADGTLKIDSFEHAASKESALFLEMLKMRLDNFKQTIDNGYLQGASFNL